MNDITAIQWSKVRASHSGARLAFGPTNIDRFIGDPKRMAFFFSRYKFAAKMLSWCSDIIDVGCGDGSGTITFASDTAARRILGIDFDEGLIEYASGPLLSAVRHVRPNDVERISFANYDFARTGYSPGQFDGLSCLDVIEHIEPAMSDNFIAALAGHLEPYGAAVIGTPNLLAAEYGSRHSKVGHINMFDPDRFKVDLRKRFRRVFTFSQNDEVVHTGFDRLGHYLLALCIA